MAKLTPEQVVEIYRRANAGERTGELAAEFGVANEAVSGIKAGRKWRWLTGHAIAPVAKKTAQKPVKPRRKKHVNEAARSLAEAYSDRPPTRQKPPAPKSLEDMLSGNPTALALLRGAAQRRAEREVEQAKRIQEMIESWDRLDEARLDKRGRTPKRLS